MTVRLEKEGAVGVIVLDRPPANSYDYGFLGELASAIDEARWDEEVRAVVVSSASAKFFSAGADVAAFQAGSKRQRAMTVLLAHETFRKMENTPMIFVAALAGHALGGGLELALACDLRFAARGSYRIGLPEVNLGLFPGSGGTQRLPRLVGLPRGLDLIVNAETLSPEQAQEAALAQVKTTLPPLQKQFEQTRDLMRALTAKLPNDEDQTFELDALQLPPELPVDKLGPPPYTIISLPVQTAV